MRFPRWSRAPFGINALGVDGEYTLRMLASDVLRPTPFVTIAYWLDDPRRRRRRERFGEQLDAARWN